MYIKTTYTLKSEDDKYEFKIGNYIAIKFNGLKILAHIILLDDESIVLDDLNINGKDVTGSYTINSNEYNKIECIGYEDRGYC